MIDIRGMLDEDLPALMNLKESVGWNQTEWDWEQFLENKEYCYVAIDEETVIGTITAYSFDNKVAWIGMVIVDKLHRGKGVSKRLLDHLIKKLKVNHRVIKLDATPAGAPVYEKFGFVTERTFDRMVGRQLNIADQEDDLMKPINDMEAVVKMDLNVIGYSRERLLRAMNNRYPGYGACLTIDNEVEGYLLGRDGSNFNQLGPLIAQSDEAAKGLLQYAIRMNQLQSAVVDVNSDKHNLIQYLEEIGFTRERSFTRMYLGSNINVHENAQYLITGPEFG